MQSETIIGLTVASDRRWALINSGTVDSVILWDGNLKTYNPPFDHVELPQDSTVGPGWTYDGTAFSAPVDLSEPA
jgi:hypothetical protein